MHRDFKPDPEVEADRRRRESAPTPPSIDELQHNDPRLAVLSALYDRKPEPIAEQWPCRICGAEVAMTPSAIAAADERVVAFNRRLAQRREPPIVPSEVMVCGACRGVDGAELQRPAQRELQLEEQTP